jgi:hypothetical protein
MNAEEILSLLKLEQVEIEVKGGHLSLTGDKSKFTSNILAEIQEHKSAIISLLTATVEQQISQRFGKRNYRHQDGSSFDLDQEDLASLVEFIEMIIFFSTIEN